MVTAESLLSQAMSLLTDGKLPEADRRFRDILSRDKRNAAAIMGLGIIAHHTRNFKLAVNFFEHALGIEPGLAAAHVNRGNSLNALQQHAAAVDAFTKALAISPTLPSALVNMATALNALGRLDDAVAALECAAATTPDSPELFNNLGNLYKDQGRLADALLAYERALKLNPMMQQAASNRLAALKLDSTLTSSNIRDAHRTWWNWFGAVSTHAPL